MNYCLLRQVRHDHSFSKQKPSEEGGAACVAAVMLLIFSDSSGQHQTLQSTRRPSLSRRQEPGAKKTTVCPSLDLFLFELALAVLRRCGMFRPPPPPPRLDDPLAHPPARSEPTRTR